MTRDYLVDKILDILNEAELTTPQKLQVISNVKARLTELKKAEIQEAINEDLELIRKQQSDLSEICYTC
ncbi:MAG: hypothetical protein ACK58Q_00075 [Chitinophagales bacterium]|jgi:hypothetical protein